MNEAIDEDDYEPPVGHRPLKRFILDSRSVLALLKGKAEVVGRPLPADASLFMLNWSPLYGGFEVVVQSEQYPHQPIGGILPLDNGPVIGGKP